MAGSESRWRQRWGRSRSCEFGRRRRCPARSWHAGPCTQRGLFRSWAARQSQIDPKRCPAGCLTLCTCKVSSTASLDTAPLGTLIIIQSCYITHIAVSPLPLARIRQLRRVVDCAEPQWRFSLTPSLSGTPASPAIRRAGVDPAWTGLQPSAGQILCLGA